jgi:hypothetical protein
VSDSTNGVDYSPNREIARESTAPHGISNLDVAAACDGQAFSSAATQIIHPQSVVNGNGIKEKTTVADSRNKTLSTLAHVQKS